MEQICKNCRLFNPNTNTCQVVILYEGEKLHLPVDGNDKCFFEQRYFNPINKKVEDFNEIKQVRIWEENKKVKIEYPEDFFG